MNGHRYDTDTATAERYQREHKTHADLLSQVADTRAEEEHVRRVLTAPLDVWPSCCGACEQGRKLCTCPASRTADLLRMWSFVGAVLAAVALTLYAMGVRLP